MPSIAHSTVNLISSACTCIVKLANGYSRRNVTPQPQQCALFGRSQAASQLSTLRLSTCNIMLAVAVHMVYPTKA